MVLPFHFLPNTIQRKTSEKSSFSSSLTLSYLLLLLLQPLPTACYFAVPDLSLENVNTAIQLTQILYKVSSPYSDNLQWESFYPETFWQSESYEEEHEEEEEEEEDEEEGWAWMSDFSVDSWLPNWSAEEDVFTAESPEEADWESYLWGEDWLNDFSSALDALTEPQCRLVNATCPDGRTQFTSESCCAPMWLSVGAPLGIGNECSLEMSRMAEQCSVLPCYQFDSAEKRVGNTDGCSYIPDVLLNHQACVIHDLCYVTPGASKSECDEAMEENINRIYCDHVNMYERQICRGRAAAARGVLGWTESHFVASKEERDTCSASDSFIWQLWEAGWRGLGFAV